MQIKRERSTLLSGLVGYWPLAEASGTRYDVHKGHYPLSAVNTPSRRIARVHYGVDMTNSAVNHLYYQDSGFVFHGDRAHTVSCWALFDALPGVEGYPVSRWGIAGDWTLSVTPTGAASYTVQRIGGLTAATTAAGTIVAGRWHFLVGWYNPVAGANGTVYVQVDGRAVASTALPAAKSGGLINKKVAIGDLGSTDIGYGAMDGGVDEVAFWQRVLSPLERRALYNNGLGLAYPFRMGRTNRWFYVAPAAGGLLRHPGMEGGVSSHWKNAGMTGNVNG